MIDYLASLEADTARLVEVAGRTDLALPVPSCPAWDLADLVWHLTKVQTFWATVVEERLDDPDRVPNPPRPAEPDLVPGLEAAGRRLVGALGAADPTSECWTWSDEHTVGFVRRRQAHEALIHRADAELAAGELPSLEAELAADGVDEILRVFLSDLPEWARFEPTGETIAIEASDTGHTWGVAFGRSRGTSPRSGAAHDLPAVSVGVGAVLPNTILRGRAADLDLWLWGRGPLDPLDVDGDAALLGALRELAVEATQ